MSRERLAGLVPKGGLNPQKVLYCIVYIAMRGNTHLCNGGQPVGYGLRSS
jgi:hypothetical protein